MYCKNCGADEPEININNKSYCSNCGLPVEEKKAQEETEQVNESTNPKEEKELNNAFSSMGSFIKDNDLSSYRSKDVRIVPRAGTVSKPVVEEAATQPLEVEAAVVLEKPIQKEIESALSLTPNVPKQKEEEKQEDTTELEKELKEQVEAVLEETDNKQSETQDPKESNKKNEIRVLEEKDNHAEEKLPKAIKKVDELGAASRLIDILEDDAKSMETAEKRKKINSLGKSFSKLIDILNQPVESPKPAKAPEAKKEVAPDPISNSLNSLNSQKEIESPLERTEIAPPEAQPVKKENLTPKEATSDSDTKPNDEVEESKADNTVENQNSKNELEKEISSILETNTESKIKDKEDTGIWPIFKEDKNSEVQTKETSTPKQNASDIEELLEQEESEKTEEAKAHLTKKQLEEIQKEIHALGDKKGHVDHWPEEEVVRIAPEDAKQEEHALTNYVKALVTHKRETKEDLKKKKKKDSKNKKESKNKTIKMITAFFGTLLLVGTLVFLLSTLNLNSNKKTLQDEEKVLTNLSFSFNAPMYIPAGYERKSITTAESNLATINYVYTPNNQEWLSLTEEKSEDKIENFAKENSKSFSVKEVNSRKYYSLDDNKLSWTENGIHYILEKSGTLEQEELLKIAESML